MSGRHVVSRRKIELTWKCTSCGRINRGRMKRCPACGSPKEKDERDIMPADTTSVPSVTDPELLKQAHAGPDWVCEMCGSKIRNDNGDCASCGGKKDTLSYHPETRGSVRYHPEQDDLPYTSQSMHPSHYTQWEAMADHDDSDPLGLARAQKMRMIGIIGVIVFVVGVVVWLFVPYKVEASVTDISWEHKVELEQRFLRHATGWKSNMPSGSFNVTCETRQRGTENCNPYDCNPHRESYSCNPYDCNCSESCLEDGNGFASCTKTCSTCYDTCYETAYDTCYEQCPVYEDWCDYDYYEWVVIDTKVASGNSHKEIWPTFDVGGRSDLRTQQYATYIVTFYSDKKDKTWKYEPDDIAEFKTFLTGHRWLIKVNRAGMVWPQNIIQ